MPRVLNRSIAIAFAVALSAYAGFLFRNLSFASGGPDTSGYMNEARLVAELRMRRPIELLQRLEVNPRLAFMFMPLGFAPSPGAKMHATYPAGLPAHLAVAGKLAGWQWAPYLVAPLAAVGAILLMYAIGREIGLNAAWSSAAGALLAVSPPFIWHAVQPASDVVATFWALLAIWCALAAQRRRDLAIAAGIAFGIGVWVRPTNALLALPLLLALRLRHDLLVRAAVGAAPMALGLAAWNNSLYGKPWRTGYGGVADVLSLETFGTTWNMHVDALMSLMTRFVFPGGLSVIFDMRANAWLRWLMPVWFGVFLVFYSWYGFFDGWLCARFLLPGIPPLILGLLIVLRDVTAAWRWRLLRIASRAAAAVLIVWIVTVTWNKNESLLVFASIPEHELHYPETVHRAELLVPDDAIVVAGLLSGAFLYYADRPIVRCDQLTDERFQMLRAYAGREGLRWYAVLAEVEISHAELEQRLRGRWTPVAKLHGVTVYRLDS